MTRSAGLHDPDLRMVRKVIPHTGDGCEDCLTLGTKWSHLRLCLTCGHVGCCDASPMRHALHHAQECGHPIVQSLRPGESWCWCYVHEALICVLLPDDGKMPRIPGS